MLARRAFRLRRTRDVARVMRRLRGFASVCLPHPPSPRLCPAIPPRVSVGDSRKRSCSVSLRELHLRVAPLMRENSVSEARFGKFEVVGFLGRGGMAEVFLCRLGGLGGFNKEVVVKRILPERVADPSFLRMFLDEARVAANLDHPNIVQVFEIDEAERAALHRHGVRPGPHLLHRDPRDGAGPAAALRPRGQDPGRRLRGPAPRPQRARAQPRAAGPGPPRRQPPEHHRLARGGAQAARLRGGQGPRAPDHHRGRHPQGQAALHGARADPAGRPRPPGRRVQRGRAAVRGHHRPQPLRGQAGHRGAAVQEHRQRHFTAALAAGPRFPRGARADRPVGHRARRGEALPQRRGPARGSGGLRLRPAPTPPPPGRWRPG